ncbi:beta-galactosidase [Streptosporangium sp. NPDC002721]|uniref:beta-galactosidase n=1 Tax=Streptosporangium sp. NPDC002721 TaxID=3366188 RepID=UPI0036CA1714
MTSSSVTRSGSARTPRCRRSTTPCPIPIPTCSGKPLDIAHPLWLTRHTGYRAEEVVPPRLAPYSVNPSGLLDFKRFTSDAMLELYRMEKSIIRAAGGVQPVTTNFMGAFEPIDYRSWAADLDLVADDSYPDPADPASFREAAFTRDLMRSLKPGIPWVLMEQAPDAVNWRASNAPKAPGQMAALSVQAVARGADGVMFFQWRQSRSGSENLGLPNVLVTPHLAGAQGREMRRLGEFAVAEVSRFLSGTPLLGRVQPEQLPYIA